MSFNGKLKPWQFNLEASFEACLVSQFIKSLVGKSSVCILAVSMTDVKKVKMDWFDTDKKLLDHH